MASHGGLGATTTGGKFVFEASSVRRRRVATIVAALSIGLAGAAWSGCGDDDADEAQDKINQAVDEAQNEAEGLSDEAQDAIDEAQDQADEAVEEAQDDADDAVQDAQDAYDDATN
jgi:ElaB/YqjD/DUF883 family membrane-anchored ribosome-binding protein